MCARAHRVRTLGVWSQGTKREGGWAQQGMSMHVGSRAGLNGREACREGHICREVSARPCVSIWNILATVTAAAVAPPPPVQPSTAAGQPMQQRRRRRRSCLASGQPACGIVGSARLTNFACGPRCMRIFGLSDPVIGHLGGGNWGRGNNWKTGLLSNYQKRLLSAYESKYICLARRSNTLSHAHRRHQHGARCGRGKK